MIHYVGVDCLSVILEYLSDPNDLLRLYASGDSVFLKQFGAVKFRNVHLKLEPFYPADMINRILINHPIHTLSIRLDREEILHPLKFTPNIPLLNFEMLQLNSLDLKLFNSFNFINFNFNNHFPNLKNLNMQVFYSNEVFKLIPAPGAWSTLISTCTLPNHLESLSWIMEIPTARFGNMELVLFNELRYLKLMMRQKRTAITVNTEPCYVLERDDIESLPKSIETLHLCNLWFTIKWYGEAGWMGWNSFPPNIGALTFNEAGGAFQYHKKKRGGMVVLNIVHNNLYPNE